MHPIAIELAGFGFRQVSMPNEVGFVRQRDPLCLARLRKRIEQAKLHSLRMLGKQRKVNPLAIPCGAERIGFTRQQVAQNLALARISGSAVRWMTLPVRIAEPVLLTGVRETKARRLARNWQTPLCEHQLCTSGSRAPAGLRWGGL